ncbi:odorant receptor 33a-like [Drosophila subobscura]|uniref:odorant receptor 33a-like n=1 Tax=Drosophila subobscura TaxID=7241 RepID=UPI00155B0D22|nr:odorant receptor 33a-like [Drosophila subobscura]
MESESNPAPFIRSEHIYRTYWLYWRLLGVEGEYPMRFLLDLMLNFFVTFWYPTHMIIGLFRERTMKDVFKNLPFTAESFFCSFKIICFRLRLAEIKRIEQLLKELDERAVSPEERLFFHQKTRSVAEFISKSYVAAGIAATVTGTASGLFSSGRALLYPAWFPYDVQATALKYWISFGYQATGASLTILQNMANDSYPPMTFCVVAGHVRMLSMRLTRMGHHREGATKKLIENIEDHRKLMQIVRLLHSTLYLSQLGQFISSGINISIVLINILFFAENSFAIIYYVVYFLAMVLELFPSCYYGTLMSMEFDKLPYAIFSSNWLGMGPRYCRTLLILMQFTLAEVGVKAGGMVGISMSAFFATIQMAYSFFTLAMSFR